MSDGTGIEERMTLIQRRIVDSGSKVIVLFEGRGTKVLGRVINGFMNMLEPRGLKYTYFGTDAPVDPRNMLRYLSREPADGQIAIYDNSWYSRIMDMLIKDDDTSDFVNRSMCFEKYLVDNGVILIKMFVDVEDSVCSIKVKGERTFLDADGCKTWSSSSSRSVIASTSTHFAPWNLISGRDIDDMVSKVAETFMSQASDRLDRGYSSEARRIVPILPNPRLDVDLIKKAPKGYRSKLDELSEELSSLQVKLASSNRSVVLVFEGWDAAGKGGTIRRITRALNPRGYYVKPVAAPMGEEKLHTYLWRFSVNLPKAGHIVIYDRSWYGRMMVEPIEGFCDEDNYSRAPEEIRCFEKNIVDAGAILLKFWMEVSPEEQLRRFKAREENPAKNYKITDEDWRNREKWDTYEEYVDRMISSTNTPYAPWIVVESEDKKYARIKTMQIIIDALHDALD